ncbi:PREDICTED: G patch domain-containing protein 4 [Polistes canadensis]|uniref:G patch domain-containing protein 4 n=1 Tax=Polistes canadensis TaxID=91411 RepID=UPI000718DF04|nr:PREDICTED: G patch domain-containing protein 4 [Polistes canadensis]
MSNFAKEQLLKYGWTEGKGLGKNENGIAEALRPKLKFNSEGLGYNSSSSTEWWQTAFDNASRNIVINKQNDEISFSVVNKNSTADKAAEIMLKSKESRQKMYNNSRKLEMTNFIKPLTLKKIEKERKEEASKKISILTDDELFKACGGRTGHKGARHGLTMSGKLERIHQQEKRLLHLMKRLTLKNAAKTATEMDGNVAKLNNNSNNNNNNNTNVAITTTNESSSKENDFQIVKSKATIKREKRNMQHLTRLLNNACNIDDITCSSNITEIKKNSSHKDKKSKDKRNKTSLISEIITSPEEKHDLVKSDQLQMHDKTYKKHKKHRVVVVKQKRTPVGNIYKVLDCPVELYNLFKHQQISKSQGDININRKSTDTSPEDSYHSRHTSCDKLKVQSISQIIKKKKLYHYRKVKGDLKWEKYATPFDDKFYRFIKNFFNNSITEDVSSKLKNLSVKGKKKETNNDDRTSM